MKKGLFVIGCWLVLMTARGQEQTAVSVLSDARALAATRVLAAAPSHPVHVAAGGLRLELRGVYVCEGMLWLAFSATNGSAIDFRAGAIRVVIRDRMALKRRALQEIALPVVFRQEPSVLRSDSTVRFCDALAPRVPGKEQELVVEWMERNGDRRVMVRVLVKKVLWSRRVK